MSPKSNLVLNAATKRTNYFRWLVHCFYILGLSAGISILMLTLTYKWVNPPLTWLMLDRYVLGETTKQKPIQYQWVNVEDVSPHFVQAVVAAEDNLFMSHWGFDYKSIKKAREEQKKGRRVRGASTISMQVSKNVFLWHDQTWTRKGLEAGFTIIIEALWSKKRIMEVYVNIAELGPSLYGVEAASKKFFKKQAKNLNRSESAILVSVLPSPLKRNPTAPTQYMRNYQQRVLRNMRNIGEVNLSGEESEPLKKKKTTKDSKNLKK